MELINSDCLVALKEMADNSVDSIVTDPPYELGFMGKKWDSTGIANNVEMWKECLRVLKPGGHLLAFSGTRTYHRMASAIEDAGFEVRDMIEWVYGSGMSKGNVWNKGKKRTSERLNKENDIMVTNGYEGWGNVGMKPSHEPIAFCRKPIEKGLTVAENCLKWGTGGINIDQSRVGTERHIVHGKEAGNFQPGGGQTQKDYHEVTGRFPSNLIHDNSEEVRECFPETKSGAKKANQENYNHEGKDFVATLGASINEYKSSSGNASRFFKSIIYQAKSSKSDRNSNGAVKNIHPTCKPTALMSYLIKMVTPKGGTVLDPFMGSGSTGVACKKNGYNFIGIELEPDYIKIAEARIGAVQLKQEELL